MIVKVVGIQEGLYREKTYDNVCDYTFTNSGETSADVMFEADKSDEDTPFSHIVLMFEKKDPVEVLFNTKAFVMGDNGKTIDVLRYNSNKDAMR